MVLILLVISFVSISFAVQPTPIPKHLNSFSSISESWARTWGGSSSDAIYNVAVDGSENVYIAGQFGGTVDFDPGVGTTYCTASGGQDVFISKFDATGNFIWVKTWGGIGREVPNGLAIDGSGNVYVSGPYQYTVDFDPSSGFAVHTSNAGSMNNVYLSKFNSSGVFQWVRTWGPADGGSESYSLAIDSANNIYVEGDYSGTSTNYNPWDSLHPDWHTNHPGPLAAFDSFLSKFDSNGNFIWARTWGGEGYDDGPGVAVDNAGNVYVAGMYASKTIDFNPTGGEPNHPAHDSGFIVDVFLSKFSSNGDFKWVRTWGGQNTEDAGGIVAIDGLGNVYAAGRYASFSCDFNPWDPLHPDIHSCKGSVDAFISKFDSSGNFVWAKTWGGTGWDAVTGLAIDGANNTYATGTFAGTAYFDPDGTTSITANGGQDIFYVKFDSSGNLQWVNTWGGSTDDWGYHVAVNQAGDISYLVGSFSNTVDFDPSTGIDNHISNGLTDAFLSKFLSPATAIILSRYWIQLE